MAGMPCRTILRLALVSACVGAVVGPLSSSPAAAAVNARCGGKHAVNVAWSNSIAVAVLEQYAEEDLYGGDHRYSACYGKHGKARTLVKFSSPEYPEVGETAFWKHYVAVEFTSGDASCGKYNPGDDCPTWRSVGAWNAKTGKRASAAVPLGKLGGLAVSAIGGIGWIEPAVAPATGQVLKYVRGHGAPVVIATGDIAGGGLSVGRTEIRYDDSTGMRHVAEIPAP